MVKQWLHYPHKAGTHSRQAHADLPKQAIYEREIGREGFFGPVSQLHHQHPPTGWSDWEGPLRPRAFDLIQLSVDEAMPWQAPMLLSNAHCEIRWWSCTTSMNYLVRNADGDDLLFIHEGQGELFCDYGHLTVTEGDYVVVPRGTLWRLEPTETLRVLMIQATNNMYHLPDKGIVGQYAIFDPAMLDVPAVDDAFRAQYSEETWQVKVKRYQQISTITYPFNPLDAIGWHGTLSVARINWRDIRPIMSHRVHLPPSVHATFVSERFMVTTFVPRPLETDPGALKVPFYHSNDDYDEIIFYHRGNFFSRDNIHPGMVTFHPCGFTHGPHPKAFAAGLKAQRTETDEVAVMIDARDAIAFSETAESVEWPAYINSWRG